MFLGNVPFNRSRNARRVRAGWFENVPFDRQRPCGPSRFVLEDRTEPSNGVHARRVHQDPRDYRRAWGALGEGCSVT